MVKLVQALTVAQALLLARCDDTTLWQTAKEGEDKPRAFLNKIYRSFRGLFAGNEEGPTES